jgi:hypothetical protein
VDVSLYVREHFLKIRDPRPLNLERPADVRDIEHSDWRLTRRTLNGNKLEVGTVGKELGELEFSFPALATLRLSKSKHGGSPMAENNVSTYVSRLESTGIPGLRVMSRTSAAPCCAEIATDSGGY